MPAKTENQRLPKDVMNNIRLAAKWNNRSVAGELREALRQHARRETLKRVLEVEEDTYIKRTLVKVRERVEEMQEREQQDRERMDAEAQKRIEKLNLDAQLGD